MNSVYGHYGRDSLSLLQQSGRIQKRQVFHFPELLDLFQFLFSIGFSNVTASECYNEAAMVSSVCQIIYLFLQLFMIFKFSNVIVNRSKRLARLAFMHCIASAICFWISAIINETMDNIFISAFRSDNSTDADSFSRGKEYI